MNSKQSELRRLMKLEREKANNTYTNTNTKDTITKDNSKIQRAIVSTKKVKGILKSTSSFSNNQQQESSSITTATKNSHIGNYSTVNADSKAKVDFIAEEEDDHQIQRSSNQPQNDGKGNGNVDTNGNSNVDAETGNNEDDDQMKEFEDFLNSVDDDVNDDNNNSINNDDDQKDGIQYEKTNEKLHNEELTTATKIASEITTESNNKVEDEMGAVNDIGNKNISNNISNSEISTHTDNTTNAIIDEVEFEQTTYEARLAKLMLLSRKRKLVGKNNDIDKNIIKGRYEYSYDEATDDNNDNDNKMIANGNENENSNDIVHTSKNTTTFKKSSIKDLLRKKLSKKSRLMKNNNQLYNDDDDDDF